MSKRSEILQAVDLLFEAINQNDTSLIPLADDVVMRGPMMPEPKSGAADVRLYLSEIAPFISKVVRDEAVVEGDRAAVTVTFELLNGNLIEGAEFFRVKDGLITEDLVYFDTRKLFQGNH
jgi:hypothetical protein